MASLDGSVMFEVYVKSPSTNGFVAFGTDGFGVADFDNLAISAS